jgi:hypothetical protein
VVRANRSICLVVGLGRRTLSDSSVVNSHRSRGREHSLLETSHSSLRCGKRNSSDGSSNRPISPNLRDRREASALERLGACDVPHVHKLGFALVNDLDKSRSKSSCLAKAA